MKSHPKPEVFQNKEGPESHQTRPNLQKKKPEESHENEGPEGCGRLPKPQQKKEPKAEPKAEPKPKCSDDGSRALWKSRSRSQSNSESGPVPLTRIDSRNGPKSDSSSETKSESRTKSRSETRSQTGPESKPKDGASESRSAVAEIETGQEGRPERMKKSQKVKKRPPLDDSAAESSEPKKGGEIDTPEKEEGPRKKEKSKEGEEGYRWYHWGYSKNRDQVSKGDKGDKGVNIKEEKDKECVVTSGPKAPTTTEIGPEMDTFEPTTCEPTTSSTTTTTTTTCEPTTTSTTTCEPTTTTTTCEPTTTTSCGLPRERALRYRKLDLFEEDGEEAREFQGPRELPRASALSPFAIIFKFDEDTEVKKIKAVVRNALTPYLSDLYRKKVLRVVAYKGVDKVTKEQKDWGGYDN